MALYPEIHEVVFYHDLPVYCGLTRSQLWHNIKIGCFPKPILIDQNGNRGWLKLEVNLWVEKMLEENKCNER